MRTLLLLATLLLLVAFVAAKKKGKCKLENGLKCYSWKTLKPGSSYTVESKTCKNGKYPRNDFCSWYFSVDGCTPTVHCDIIDIKGNGKKCRGDKLTLISTNEEEVLCGKMENVTFSPETVEYDYLTIEFSTNHRGEGKGFSCSVSCREAPPTTTLEPATTDMSSDCECGLPNRVKRIVGGVETETNEYPWQVGVSSPLRDVPFCGGSILSSSTIVTAAHCTVDSSLSDLEVIVGDHDVTVDDDEERFAVCVKVEHPDYDSYTNENDISILTLCSPIIFRQEVAPVCLPTLPGSAYDNVLATVSGWGTLQAGGFQPNQLMEVYVTTMDNEECGAFYGGYEDIIDSMICASGEGKDACQGDSGGPLVTLESSSFYSLIGVVSWGYGCADPDFPGVYSRVTENMEFIRNNMGGSTCQVPGLTPTPSTPSTSFGTEITLPTTETTLPTTEITLPTTEITLPTTETTLPTTEITLPTTEITLPTTEITLPTTEITLPTTEMPTTPSESNSTPITETPTGSSGCSCGVANRANRIVGGVMTEVNEYPWQIGLVGSGTRPYCGGSILSSKTILTAAHCTAGTPASSLTVVVAEHDWTAEDGQERFSVCGKTEHPAYDSNTVEYDFSILTLCDEIAFKREASPVCLPAQSGSSYDGVTATVSGWGTLSSGGSQPQQLMEVDVSTITNTACNAAYRGAVTASMICAAEQGKDACQGDSGGPMVTKEQDSYYSQIGVVSWGAGCADPNFPGVYSRVTEVTAFIQDNMSGDTCPPPA